MLNARRAKEAKLEKFGDGPKNSQLGFFPNCLLIKLPPKLISLSVLINFSIVLISFSFKQPFLICV
jgi:hypothetical protein